MDGAGNIYVTGGVYNGADFDPGPGTTTLPSAGLDDIFIAKYTSTGALVWAQSIGTTNTEAGWSIDVDTPGNVYVSGQFQGTMDFDPGPGSFTLTSAGSTDAFVCKLDTLGNFVWAKQWGGSGGELATAVTVDGPGDVFVAGRFTLSGDFDPGPGTQTLTSAGTDDVFVCKLDSAGNLAWVYRIGGAQIDNVNSIVVDAAGNVYLNGSYGLTVDFDPGPGVFNLTSAAGSSGFVSKLDPTGNFMWAISMEGSTPAGIDLDSADNVYLTGQFGTAADFDPGPGVVTFTNFGVNTDVYVCKLDSTGGLIWVKQLGGPVQDNPWGVGVDALGNVYVAGGFNGTADFDPSPAATTFTSAGNTDIFAVKLNSIGDFLWAYGTGSTLLDTARSCVVDPAGVLYVTGYFGVSADFDPGLVTANLTAVGDRDIFLASYSDNPNGIDIVQSGGTTGVSEAGSSDTYTLFLETAPTANVTVTLSAGSQLNVNPAVLTFTPADWNVPQAVTIAAMDDFLMEGPHTGTITHLVSSTDLNYNGITVASVVVNLTDNDTASLSFTQAGGSLTVAEGGTGDSYTVQLTSQPTSNVNVALAPGTQLTAASVLIFTPANWNIAQSVTVTAVDDLLIEGAHSGTISHTTSSADANYNLVAVVTAAITDNDNADVQISQTGGATDISEAGLTDSYLVVLGSLPAANVVIIINPGSQLNVLPTSLIFTPANWNVAQPVLVQANDDAIAQGTRSQTITHAATSSDPLYNGIAIAAITVNITDNDVAGITFSTLNVDVSEGGTSNTYTAVLNSQPTANVIINLAGDSQVSLATATLVFTPGNWNVPQTISVRAVDDTLAEGLHNGLITHMLASGDTTYNAMTRTVTARITDDDNPSVLITQTSGPLTILEGSSKTYTAMLNSPPSSDVVLNISPDAQVRVSPTSITFTPGDWNVPRPIVVTANDDGVEEGDHDGRIMHTTSSASAAFNNLTVPSVTAGIVDNDGAAAFGTERADQILVSFTTANIKVTVNGKLTILPNTLTQLLLFASFGNDSIQVIAPTIPVVVVGGPGVDKVFITGQTASNNFVLGDSFVTANGRSIGVWETESLTVGGKAGNDTFTVMDVPAFPVELKGDAGTDLVNGPARSNTWQITGASAGTLDSSIKISAMENWTGGDSSDSFVFAPGKSIAGRIDGGLGQNTLDFSAATAAITVNLQTSIATGSKSFANITGVVGGKGVADKLVAADQSNLWNITAANSGSVSGVSFRNFENLTGGIQDDTFLFADNQGVKGKIDGGLGSDVLDFSAYLSRPVSINLQLKAATNTGGFANLEAFQGGSGTADSLIGPNKINAWNLTGPGSGTVTGATFGNFENLTGGSLADNFTLNAGADWLGTLNGGTGNDTLTAFPGANTWVLTGLNTGTLNGRKFAGVEIRR